MTRASGPDAKVLFRISYDDGSTMVETLWAYDLGEDRYKLDNSPFYAYGVSWEDVVYAPFDEAEGRPTYQRVISRSGNRTVRVIFDVAVQSGTQSHRVVDELCALGCSYEGTNGRYIAVNIPPAVDLATVASLLTDRRVTWEYGDAGV